MHKVVCLGLHLTVVSLGFIHTQTIRVTMLQSAHALSKYMTDQVKEDVERDELVAKGVMTQEEADEESDEWSQVRLLFVFMFLIEDGPEKSYGRMNDGLLRCVPRRCLKRDFKISFNHTLLAMMDNGVSFTATVAEI
jgi:hypothetical protein